MARRAVILTRVVGAACLVLAIAAYWYTFAHFVKRGFINPDIPYFHQAYLTMTTICLAFYTILLAFGLQFLMRRIKYRKLFFLFLVIEALYFVAILLLLALFNRETIQYLFELENREVARLVLSVMSAMSVANRALTFQLLTGFIIWAPLLLQWASKIDGSGSDSLGGETAPS